MKYWSLLLLCSLLNACGQQPPAQTSKEIYKKLESALTLQGNVSNNNGLIKQGKLEARDNRGELLAETTLDNSAHYQLEIPAGAVLPIVISYSGIGQSAATDKMLSVVVQPSISKYDVNPLTTAIAKQAKHLGGYTLRNMTRAAEDAVHIPDANKTSTGFRGDPTTQYGGWH